MSDTLHEIITIPDFPEGEAWCYVEFEVGDTIIAEGEETRDVYLVVEGVALVNKLVDLEGRKGIQSGIGKLVAGDLFGELGLFVMMPRSASITAQTQMKVIKINGEALAAFLDDHPELGYRFLKEMFIRIANLLRKADDRMANLFAWGLRAYDIDKEL